MLTARIARTTAAFIVIVGFADIAAAQTATTTTTQTNVTAQGETTAPAHPDGHRPFMLAPLYGSFIALQGFDIDSTIRGSRSGKTQEANPMMQPMSGSPAMLIAFKAGTTAAIISVCEQLRKEHHGTAAVLVMIGLNS